MEGLGGVETARRLRAFDPDCLLVFSTFSPDHALEGYRVQAAQYLVKPYAAAELERVPGLGRNAAVLLKLVPELYRKAILSASANETVLNTTDRIGEFFRDLLAGQSKEVMYQLCLDAKGRKLHVYKLGEGDVGSVGLNVRRIMENALHTNAMMVVLAHNHPSGVALPSREDETATELAREALDAMGVALVDHIIVADNDYVSLRESGRIRA